MLHIDDFTRQTNDVNGNPRYAVHYMRLLTEQEQASDYDPGKYSVALARARQFGGRKFHNKRYGGGIVFQEYNLRHLVDSINAVLAAEQAKQVQA